MKMKMRVNTKRVMQKGTLEDDDGKQMSRRETQDRQKPGGGYKDEGAKLGGDNGARCQGERGREAWGR